MASDRSRRLPARALAACLLAMAASPDARGQARAPSPEATPLPPERPEELRPATAPGAAVSQPPLPPERPADLAQQPSEPKALEPKALDPKAGETPVPLPPERPPELSGAAALALKVAAPDDTACRVRLKRLGASFEPLPPISNGQCGTPLPLKVTALADIALPQAATLTCGAAEALARWATEVQSAAERELKEPLKAIQIGTTYECRGQNHDIEAKLSEHAFANGIDVMEFTFAGRPAIAVEPMPEGSAEGRFLDAVRGRACAVFRTVLGPGSNAEHANHLHLDERERSAGHRLCQ